jgi:hypothetical protein
MAVRQVASLPTSGLRSGPSAGSGLDAVVFAAQGLQRVESIATDVTIRR